MDGRKKLYIGILVIAVLTVAGFLWTNAPQEGGVKKSPEIASGDAFGVVDLDAAVRAHPDYEKFARLSREREALESEIGTAADFPADLPPLAVELKPMEEVLQQKRMQRLTAKHEEINKRLGEREKALRAQYEPEFRLQMKQIDDVYSPQIFNLQLKIDTLHMSKEAAQETQEKIVALKSEQGQKVQELQTQFFEKISREMNAEQAKAEQEFSAYVSQVDAELSAEMRQKQDEIETRNHLAMAKKSNEIKIRLQTNADIQRKAENKGQEMAALKDMILKDIGAKAAKIAIEKKLTVVVVKTEVTIGAEDITEDIIRAFKE